MKKITPIKPKRRVVFMLRHKQAGLIDVATGKEKPYESVDEAWEAKIDYEAGKVDILI